MKSSADFPIPRSLDFKCPIKIIAYRQTIVASFDFAELQTSDCAGPVETVRELWSWSGRLRF